MIGNGNEISNTHANASSLSPECGRRPRSWRVIAAVLVGLCLAGSTPAAEKGLAIVERLHDFGSLDISRKYYFTYELYNEGTDTVRLLNVDANCDCTKADLLDSTLYPGDTARIRLEFDTEGMYGYFNKSIILTCDSRFSPEIQFFYKGTVGQWAYAIRPNPSSLFFLPGSNRKTVSLGNPKIESIRVLEIAAENEWADVEIIKDSARKGESVQLAVTAKPDIREGTHHTSFQVKLEVSESDEPVLLSIPIKIVRY